MLKTLKRKIALVAVAALGAGGLSIAVAPSAFAAIAADEINLEMAGSSLAVTKVTAGGFAGIDTAAARAGTQTIVLEEVAAVTTNADDYNVAVCLNDGTPAAAEVTSANCLTLTYVSVSGAAGERSTVTPGSGAGVGVAASGFMAAADKALLVASGTGTNAATYVTFTTSSMAAGSIYDVWIDTAAGDNWGTGAQRVGNIVVQQSGAPTSVSFNHAVGETQVRSSAQNRTWKASLKDAAGRSTFLVGDETIQYAWSPVAAGITALTGVTARAAIFPTIADTTGYGAITPYDVVLDLTTAAPTVGNLYTLGATVQSGLSAFGSDSATYRHLTSTSGLATTISVIDAAATTAAGADTEASSATFAAGDASTTDYDFKVLDAAGAVVSNVTPSISSVLGNAVTITVTNENGKGDLGYTATNAGSDTVSISIAGGSAGISTKAFPITVGASYATNIYAGAWEATVATGGKLEIADVADADLSNAPRDNYAMYLDPASVSSISVKFNLSVSATAVPVASAPIALSVLSSLGTIDVDNGGARAGTGNVNTTFDTAYNAGALLAASLRTANAETVTNSSGDVGITVNFSAPRNGEGFTIVAKSGSTTLGRAAFFFQTAAVTNATVSAGPAQAITQKAGTSTAVEYTVTDQYGNGVAAGKRVGLTVVGPSAPASGTAIVLTNGSGKAIYTLSGATAVAGQTDTVTLASYDGNVLTAQADDIVAVTYSTSAPDVASLSASFGINQAGTYDAITTTFTTATATATPTAAIEAAMATPVGLAAAIWTDSKALPIDTLGDFVGTTTISGATTATFDEVVDLRWTVKNSGGANLAGIAVEVSASEGAHIVGALGTAVSTRTLYSNTSGQVTVRVFATKTGTATFTAKAGTVSSPMSWAYANDLNDARTVSITPTLSAPAGTIGNLTVTIKDRYGNPVPGVTGTYTEVGSGRLEANSGASDANGTVTLDYISAATETGTSTVTAAISAGTNQEDDKAGYVHNGVGSVTTATTDGTNGVPAAPAAVKSAKGVVTLSGAAAVANPALDAVKSDVKAVSDTVATLSKAVTTIQSSVTELTSSFSAQIKSLSSAIAKISRAIAALSKRIR